MDDDRLWTGPLFGRLGALTDDGERVQCHVCGDFFGNLGGHISQVHGLTPDDYKARFGLNATTGLIGPALKAARQREAEERKLTPDYARFVAAGERARATEPPGRRSTKGRRLRLEQRLDPKVQASRRAALARANEVLAQRRADGTYRPAGWAGRDPKEISSKGHARLKELRADPAWRETFARRVSEARGGRLQVTCVVCGTTFVEPHSHRRRKTCGPACRQTLRQRTNAERQAASADDKARRVALGTEFGRRRREQGLAIERLATLSGLSPAHVSRIERGLNVPSDAALARIAAVLDAPLEQPVPASDTEDRRSGLVGARARYSGARKR